MKLTNAQVDAIVPLLEVYAVYPSELKSKLSAKREVKGILIDDLIVLTIRYTGVRHIAALTIEDLQPGDPAVEQIPGALALCQQIQNILDGLPLETRPQRREEAPSSPRTSIWERLNSETAQ